MTTFWWVRHGPTHAKSFVGHLDLPADLSDRAAIARLSAHLPDSARVVSSDLSRAVATADALSAPGRSRLPHAPALREFDFGEWDGKSFDEVAASHPDLSRAFWERPGPVAPPGGESWQDVAARVSAVVDALTGTAEHVIAVAHLGVIATQVARARGQSPAEAIGQPIRPLSVTRLTVTPTGWEVGEVDLCP